MGHVEPTEADAAKTSIAKIEADFYESYRTEQGRCTKAISGLAKQSSTSKKNAAANTRLAAGIAGFVSLASGVVSGALTASSRESSARTVGVPSTTALSAGLGGLSGGLAALAPSGDSPQAKAAKERVDTLTGWASDIDRDNEAYTLGARAARAGATVSSTSELEQLRLVEAELSHIAAENRAKMAATADRCAEMCASLDGDAADCANGPPKPSE